MNGKQARRHRATERAHLQATLNAAPDATPEPVDTLPIDAVDACRLAQQGAAAGRYFHGGVPGLNAGDWLLPPARTGTPHTTSRFLRPEDTEPWLRRRDRVYITPILDLAWGYAAAYPNGAIYLVRPGRPLRPDPDSSIPFVSSWCRSAQVVEVFNPVVPLADLLAQVLMNGLAPLLALKVQHHIGALGGTDALA